MPLDLPALMRLVGMTLVSPSDVATWIVAQRHGRDVLWMALALVAVASVLMLAITQLVLPMPPPSDGAVEVSPLTYTVIVGSLLVMLVFSIFFTGQALGGTGTFPAAIALITWFGAMGIAVRTVLAVVVAIAPSLTATAGLAGAVALLWCLVNFVNVLHGYKSLAKAAGVLALTLVGLLFGVATILALIGVGATGGAS